MKPLFQLLLLPALLVFFNSCSGNAQSAKAAAASGPDRIEVLDFHTAHRCHTCLEIERMTKETLAQHYGKQMEKGQISFKLVNADDKANDALVKKYLAFGTTLIVSVVKDGKVTHTDLTNFAFMNAGNEKKFTAGLKEQIENGLKALR